MERPIEERDFSWLRDLTDIIKNKTLFFIPFFGAFLAFLLAKTDYLANANWVIWLICAAIFFGSVRYIYVVSKLLWLIETVRFIFNVKRSMEGEYYKDWEKSRESVVNMLKLLPSMAELEDIWFRRTMLMMYIGAFTVLIDLFIGKALSQWLLQLIGRLLQK